MIFFVNFPIILAISQSEAWENGAEKERGRLGRDEKERTTCTCPSLFNCDSVCVCVKQTKISNKNEDWGVGSPSRALCGYGGREGLVGGLFDILLFQHDLFFFLFGMEFFETKKKVS